MDCLNDVFGLDLFASREIRDRSGDFKYPLHMKSYRSFAFWLRGLEQFLDGLKNDLELMVVFLLHFFNFPPQIRMLEHKLPQFGEGPHNLNIYLHGSFAIEDAGQHENSMFGKGIRLFTAATPT